jgi:hypothetical protein
MKRIRSGKQGRNRQFIESIYYGEIMNMIKTEIKWAIIFILMMLSWMALERLGGFHDVRIEQHAIVTNFIFIPAVAVYVFAFLDKRRNVLMGEMTYKQGFISGLIISLFVTIVSPLTQLITSAFITPHYFENVINYTVSNGLKTEAEARDYFNLNHYIIEGLIFTPVMGAATSAIVAIFTRRKRQNQPK